jgi:hypothetical protein
MDDFGGEPLALQEAGEPSQAHIRSEAGKALELLFRFSLGDVSL